MRVSSKWLHRAAPLLAAIVCVSVLFGCGGSDPQVKAIRATLIGANDAGFNGDFDRECSYYTPDVQRHFISVARRLRHVRNCSSAARLMHQQVVTVLTAKQQQEMRDFMPSRIEVQGDTATATYGDLPTFLRYVPGIQQANKSLQLVRSNGRWLIASTAS